MIRFKVCIFRQKRHRCNYVSNKKGIIALSPLVVFLVLYLVTSIIVGDFYKVPIIVAFMIASIYAIAISGGFALSNRISIFSRGASAENMMLMLWIFVLAGAFANSAKHFSHVCTRIVVDVVI